MFKRSVVSLFVATAMLSIQSVANEMVPTIQVSGSHQEKVEADQYDLKILLVARSTKREGLSDALNRKRSVIRKILQDRKIKEDQYGYTQAALKEEFQWNEGKRTLVGYSIQEEWLVEVKSAESNNQLIKQIAGANEIDHYESFPKIASKAVYQKSLKMAVQNARSKASLMADELGLCLGQAINIVENSSYHPGPVRFKTAMMSMEASSDMPSAQVSSEASVRVSWKLKDCD